MAICYSRYGGSYYCNGYSRWGSWGRWVLLGCILAAALIIALLFACITSRRRRRAGRKPFYGTGWAAPNNMNSTKPQMQQQTGTATYNGSNNQQSYGANPYNNSAPPYNSTQQQTYGQGAGQNADYYGGSTAQTGQYAPPSYPPPAQTRV